MSKAIILVDVQNDFCEGGSLPVTGGAAVAAAISAHLSENHYPYVVATRDYHVDPGAHFSAEPDFTRTWPVHCVAGTPGSAFHPELDVVPIQAVFSKGRKAAAYSGFEGADKNGTGLADWLHKRGVTELDIAGIATDHCVRATALDAAAAGFATTVLLDLTAGVTRSTVDTTLAELAAAGVGLTGTPHVG